MALFIRKRDAAELIAHLAMAADKADADADDYALRGDFPAAERARAMATAYVHSATLAEGWLGVPSPPAAT